MKKSVLTLLCVGALMACKKNETSTVDRTTDSTAMMPVDNSPAMVKDSVAVTPSALNDQDKKFADDAARGGMMEVMLGQLSATNATSAKVKTMGQMMVQDHGKGNEELKKWAAAANYTLPTGLDAEKQKNYDDLKSKKGNDFDRAYAEFMVKDHKKDIAAFKKEVAGGADKSLKSFAEKTIPILERHLVGWEDASKAFK